MIGATARSAPDATANARTRADNFPRMSIPFPSTEQGPRMRAPSDHTARRGSPRNMPLRSTRTAEGTATCQRGRKTVGAASSDRERAADPPVLPALAAQEPLVDQVPPQRGDVLVVRAESPVDLAFGVSPT